MTETQQFFTQLNGFFDKIYVITLERATKRHQHIKKELQGLDYEFFIGKDKLQFSIAELTEQNIYNEDLAITNHRYSKPLTAGAIACSWSHFLVYAEIVNKGFQKVLIMEDDIVIDQKAIRVLPEIFEKLPQNWELLYFGFAANEAPPANAFFKKNFYHLVRFFGGMKFSHRTINNHYPKRVTEHLYKAGYHDCTHAYGITQSAAKKLMNLQTPISFLSDNLLAHAATNRLVNAFITRPKIINQLSQVENGSAHSYINE